MRALYLMFETRPDLFSGGHQHHDAGHFYLSAHGVDRGVEGNNGLRSSLVHSVMMIDAKGQGAAQHLSPMRVKSFTARATEAVDLPRELPDAPAVPRRFDFIERSRLSAFNPH
jgi:hypothetical protein